MRFEPVGVLLLAVEDLLQQVARAVVALVPAQRDAAVEPLDGVLLEIESELELLAGVLTDLDGAEPLQVRHAIEIEDPFDEDVGVLHLVDRLLPERGGQPFEAPVGEHLGVDEVLVDGRELGGQHFVETVGLLLYAVGVISLARNAQRRSNEV